MGGLRVEGVDGDHGAGQVLVVDRVEQGRELGDLVGFGADLTQGRGQGVVVAHSGEHEDAGAVGAAGATQAFAVHGERAPTPRAGVGIAGGAVGAALFAFGCAVGASRACGRRRERGEPVADGGQCAGGDVGEQIAQGPLARGPVAASERVERAAQGGPGRPGSPGRSGEPIPRSR
ncbi:hypothetical protein TNCT6_03100 [Streptomyces sp. 6-11-2]|nr:hypothetical protein TNCT6_03100 [Streptomyces sp. 6-11-2]